MFIVRNSEDDTDQNTKIIQYCASYISHHASEHLFIQRHAEPLFHSENRVQRPEIEYGGRSDHPVSD